MDKEKNENSYHKINLNCLIPIYLTPLGNPYK